MPLFVLFVSAAVWLLAASGFGLIASIKFHSPDFLANCPWLTYGRVHAAATNALLYGFALQAGLGVALWIIARLGRTRVAQPLIITFGGKLWNLGVTVGIIGILAGDSTGFENVEMPRYAAVILFLAYGLIGVCSVVTLHCRTERCLRPSQWFLLAALFWFPWIFSTAYGLLTFHPVRGVMQSVVAWWFSANLNFVWLGLVGLGTAFYFIEQWVNRPLHSRYLALFTFWTLILFASWSGIPDSAPVPAWMPTLSTVATVLTAVTVAAVILNVYRTVDGGCRQTEDPAYRNFFEFRRQLLMKQLTAISNLCRTVRRGCSQTPGRFMAFGLMAFVVSWLMNIIGALPGVSPITTFTWFIPAQWHLNVYGFFAMTMFGAIYTIVPQVTGLEWPSAKFARAHFWLAAIGIILFALPLAIGGIIQGIKLNQPTPDLVVVTKMTLHFLRISTIGELLILAGNVLLLANLAGLSVRYYRTHFKPVVVAATTELKSAEVRP